MAEQPLDVADVYPGLDQLRCGGVAQHVRRYATLDASSSGRFGEPRSHRRGCKRFVVQVEEKARVREVERAACSEIGLGQLGYPVICQEDLSLAAALAHESNRSTR